MSELLVSPPPPPSSVLVVRDDPTAPLGAVDPDDAEIGRRFAAGDEQALALAYQRWSGQVHGMAVRAFGPGPDAEDVTQQRRGLVLVAAAAVAGAVLGAGVTALVRGDDATEPVTAVALDALTDEQATGRAEVVVREDDSRALQVDLDAPALEDEYYELWLIEPDVVDMVSLGVLRPGTQTFELPAALDLGEFPLVDVSVEPIDGDPTHSGVSVARGELDS
ncbi:anti-sigma factor domain-containing protein [Blastococcus atacamensis]|uniref:anti-sigma factor domain-containing protein n=1 Tax=Blastococcus atacamensis TaxID=2070508 RepID=UPI0018E4A470